MAITLRKKYEILSMFNRLMEISGLEKKNLYDGGSYNKGGN
jgi:hypothetical protein